MSTRLGILCGPAEAQGFQMAGIAGVRATLPETAAEALSEIGQGRDVGVVLVDERLLDALPADLRATLDRQARPIIIPLPAPEWEQGLAAAEARVVALLRRAIGYRVRLG